MPDAPFAWSYEKTQVDYDGRALTINDRRVPLDEVERLSRTFSVSTAQGSWNRLECGVYLYAAGEVSSVRFHGDATKADWGPWRPFWDQLDEVVRDEIEPRLLERTIGRVKDGTLVEIGSGRAKGRGRFTVTVEALQARTWFSKPIPWKAMTEVSDDVIEITTIDPAGKRRKHRTGLHSMEWDAWQVRQLWRHFGAG